MKRKFVLDLATAFALCFALAHSVYAQSPTGPLKKAAPVDPNISTGDITFAVASSANQFLDKSSGLAPAVPGTIETASAPTLKPKHTSLIRVEPGYLPACLTDQPLAYLKYGAAPAVVTLQFGHK
jgi:hypothetical protein